ncbi:MAG: indolepyruvate oxidoreductase subunit beta [Bacillota bacterium]|nr:indolepyruvate oxidoreductase subunit beta [Bacillota bacterium]
MKKVKNVLLSGVGGQGIILASKVLSVGLIEAGFDVKMSEVHGMAQRGGSVTTQVRFGEKVYSPIIGLGQADILVGFEKMEAGKWLEFLNPAGKIVINDFKIPSAPILTGDVQYPEGIIKEIKSKIKDVTVVDGPDLAKKVGNVKTMNIAIMGSLIKALELDKVINWEEVIAKVVKEKFVDVNIKAFNLGMAQVK